MRHYQDDVNQWLNDHPGSDALDMLREFAPDAEKAFKKADKAIVDMMAKVSVVFPNAELYTSGGDGFALLLGQSHTNGRGNQHLEALHGKAKVGGGDW